MSLAETFAVDLHRSVTVWSARMIRKQPFWNRFSGYHFKGGRLLLGATFGSLCGACLWPLEDLPGWNSRLRWWSSAAEEVGGKDHRLSGDGRGS